MLTTADLVWIGFKDLFVWLRLYHNYRVLIFGRCARGPVIKLQAIGGGDNRQAQGVGRK